MLIVMRASLLTRASVIRTHLVPITDRMRLASQRVQCGGAVASKRLLLARLRIPALDVALSSFPLGRCFHVRRSGATTTGRRAARRGKMLFCAVLDSGAIV